MVHGLGEIKRKRWSWVGHKQVTIAQVWAKGKERRRTRRKGEKEKRRKGEKKEERI
jgi:hypothetical protein